MKAEIVTQQHFDFDDDASFAPEPPPVNPLLLVHRQLRGHYVLAILLSVLLAVPLAILGYSAVPPKYTSTGLINIAPTKPYILYENEYTERMSSFDSFVQSQTNLLRSQRILSMAASSTALRDAGWKPLPAGLIELSRGIQVSVPRGGQDIFVRVSSTDPRLAQAATNAVLAEYSKIAIEKEALLLKVTTETVEDIREQARQERDDARNRAYQLAEREGTDNLARRLEAKHGQVERFEQLLIDLNFSLLPYEANPVDQDPQSPDQNDEPIEDIPVEALALNNPALAVMLTRREQIKLEITSLMRRFSPAHRQIVSLNDELLSLDAMIDAQAAIARAERPDAGRLSVPVEVQLRRQVERLGELLKITNDDARRIGRLQLEIDQFREKAARADEKFREADARLDSLLIEKRAEQQGRISILEPGADLPLAPSTDRRLPLAALGAIAGGTAGIGIVVLVGVLRPRYRYVGDIEDQRRNIHIIGAIPEINAEDAASRELLASGVHQIRTAIDARLLGPAQQGLVHLVTSATAGEGKSTVTLRLARSFAVSGKNTLIVDADLIGRQITSNFGFDRRPGFADSVIDQSDPRQAIQTTQETNLSILPAGTPAALTPERISASAVSEMLDKLRQDYDAVLIDTGPILGSIEAQAIVPSSNEVLLVVSRGTGVRLVKLAIDRLYRLGSPRLGVIFNKATMQDLERSTSFSMTSQRVSESNTGRDDAHASLDAHLNDHPTSSAG